MKKVILKNCDVKEFNSLIKRSASLDNLIFIDLKNNEFESVAYNKTRSALKSISANLENYCGEFVNELADEVVKMYFSNANKLNSALNLVGAEDVDVTFYIDEKNYAKKVVVANQEVNLTVPAAEEAAVSFMEIPSDKRFLIFDDLSTLQYRVGITDSEFKYLQQFFSFNKDAMRVFFTIADGTVTVSEIEATDDNVRDEVNKILDNGDIEAFNAYEKLYSKKLNCDTYSVEPGVENYLRCFNKTYFVWIDSDKHYDVEFHTNKVKFISVDDKNTKTYVVYTPVRFA